MYKCFRPGDIVVARVVSLYSDSVCSSSLGAVAVEYVSYDVLDKQLEFMIFVFERTNGS